MCYEHESWASELLSRSKSIHFCYGFDAYMAYGGILSWRPYGLDPHEPVSCFVILKRKESKLCAFCGIPNYSNASAQFLVPQPTIVPSTVISCGFFSSPPTGNHLSGCRLKNGHGGTTRRNVRAVPASPMESASLMS